MSLGDSNRLVLDLLEKEYAKAKGKKEDKVLFKLKNVSDILDWREIRPNMNEDFDKNDIYRDELVAENVPFQNQERQVVSDLLSCFQGGNGSYIQAEPIANKTDTRCFRINQDLDTKLYDLTKKCLKLAEYYSHISRFLEDNRMLSVGRVNQALSYAMDTTMIEYKSFILDLSNSHIKCRLHLAELWYRIQNVIQILEILSRTALDITKHGFRGGTTLTYLLDKSCNYMSDKTHSALFQHLIKKAAVPYMESVKEWIFNGVIFDPFDEFMIVEKVNLSFKDCQSLEHWEKKYQLRQSCVPSFLVPFANEIWKAGVYLNVIRENIVYPSKLNLAEVEEIKYSSNQTKYVNAIKKAYIHSSSNLLYYMMDKYKLVQRFVLMKKYFLVQQGDFVVQLFDTCDKELSKSVLEIIPSRLKTLVDMAIRGAECSLRDDLTISFQPYDLWHQVSRILSVNSSMNTTEHDQKNVSLNTKLTGYESFTLNINCKWPVSFLFNTRIISSYQMLFRLLFYCKHVEQCLFKVWIIDQKLRKYSTTNQKPYCTFFALRHRMIYFIQNIQYYMMEEAIEPNWIEFQQQLTKITEQTTAICTKSESVSLNKVYSIDDLLDHHKKFLDKCISDCLLSNSTIFPIFMKLLSICKEFASLITDNEHILTDTMITESDGFTEAISTVVKEFHNQYMELLTSITEFAPSQAGTKILEILHRANFNGYFTSLLEDYKSATVSYNIIKI